MVAKRKELTGLRGLKNTEPADDLKGNTAKVIADELKAGLTAFEEKLTGLKSEIEKLKADKPDADILKPVLSELEGLKADMAKLTEKELDVSKEDLELFHGYKARLDIMANALQSPGGGAPQPPKTIGEIIAEAEGFKSVVGKAGGGPASYRIDLHDHTKAGDVRSLLSGVKAAPTLGAAELGALNWSFRQQEIVKEIRESVAAFVPMIGVVPTPGHQVYEWPAERADGATGYQKTTLGVAIDGDPTPKTTCTVIDSTYFIPGTYLRFFDANHDLVGRKLLVSVNTGTHVLTFDTDDLDFDAEIGDLVTSEEWYSTPESAAKPYNQFAGETGTTNLITIASLTSVTRQQLLSPAGIQAWIEQDMPERWRRNVAYQLLYGTGTANKQLPGFATASGVQTYLWSSGTVGDNRLDAMLSAALLIVGDNLAFVMNKRDVNELRKLKDTSGNYLRASNMGMITLDRNAAGNLVIDGLYEIIVSDAVKDGDFFCVDFAMASKIPDSEDEALEIGLVNNQFAINERTIRYEHTIGHAIQRLGSYVYGTWDNTPAP